MEKSSFFNSVSHDRTYKAEDWAEYFASFIGNGVFPVPSTGLQVVANDGMKLNVKTGKAWINGYFYFNTGDLAVELDTADGQLNRIDRVVVRWDLTNRVMSVKVKSSSFSASPTAPALQRDADVYELALADIYVGAGVTAITQSKITDQRLNTSLCGVVAAVVQQIDTAAFNAQLQAWFAEYQSLSAAEYNTLVSYMNSLKLQGNTQYEAFEQHMADFETQAAADFNAWFNGLQTVLDDNAATNLLNITNALDARVDMLEAVLFNDITTNPFLILFDDLDGVTSIKVTRDIPAGGTFKVEATNNPFDASPVWEDCTNAVVQGVAHVFENKINTAAQYGMNIRVTVERGDALTACWVSGIGGNFE